MVPGVGFEPTRLSASVFETDMSAVPSPGHNVQLRSIPHWAQGEREKAGAAVCCCRKPVATKQPPAKTPPHAAIPRPQDQNVRLVHRNTPATVDEAGFSVLPQNREAARGSKRPPHPRKSRSNRGRGSLFGLARKSQHPEDRKCGRSPRHRGAQGGFGSREARQRVVRTENPLVPHKLVGDEGVLDPGRDSQAVRGS